MGGVPSLGIPGEDLDGVTEALSLYRRKPSSRKKEGFGAFCVSFRSGSTSTVIGAGNTAIDAATIAKRLGAERVTIVYRRGEGRDDRVRLRVHLHQK